MPGDGGSRLGRGRGIPRAQVLRFLGLGILGSMDGERIFVGREAELERFGEVLDDPRGQAVVVVGAAGAFVGGRAGRGRD